eukprot:7104799-Heterocapsa_arctica.AAC.1
MIDAAVCIGAAAYTAGIIGAVASTVELFVMLHVLLELRHLLVLVIHMLVLLHLLLELLFWSTTCGACSSPAGATCAAAFIAGIIVAAACIAGNMGAAAFIA